MAKIGGPINLTRFLKERRGEADWLQFALGGCGRLRGPEHTESLRRLNLQSNQHSQTGSHGCEIVDALQTQSPSIPCAAKILTARLQLHPRCFGDSCVDKDITSMLNVLTLRGVTQRIGQIVPGGKP